MTPVNEKIIVEVDPSQKDNIKVGGVTVSTALRYEKNYREKSPVVAKVIEGNQYVNSGDILLVHHNAFYLPSPYHLSGNLFSIPASNILFAIVKDNGSLNPIYGNILCDRVPIESKIPLPPEQQGTYINRALVKDGGNTRYKSGQLIFHRPYAGYDICYVFGGIENRVCKVHESQVCGILK